MRFGWSAHPSHMSLQYLHEKQNFRLPAVNATSVIDPERVVHHVGVASKDRKRFLQLVIVDRFEYSELSSRLMESLRRNLLDRQFASESTSKSFKNFSRARFCRAIKVLFRFWHAVYAQREWSRSGVHFRDVSGGELVYVRDLRLVLR